jgi:hypothetical protein
MQKVFTSWRAATESFPLGEQQVGLLKPGRYSGYDLLTSNGGGLGVYINHSTRVLKTKTDNTFAPTFGAIMMPTGIIIHDDSELSFVLASNFGNSNERIDYLICENIYQEVEGGTPGIYSIIQGPNNGNEPNLTNPEKQVLIGKIGRAHV